MRFSGRSENPSPCCRTSAPGTANPTNRKRRSWRQGRTGSDAGDRGASTPAPRESKTESTRGNRTARGTRSLLGRRRLKPAVIPGAPDYPGPGEDRLRNAIKEPMVRSQPKRRPAGSRERDVIAGNLDAVETVVFLEVAQAVALFVPFGEPRVHEVGHLSLRTAPDRLGHQRVRRSLVPLPDHRHNLHDGHLSF